MNELIKQTIKNSLKGLIKRTFTGYSVYGVEFTKIEELRAYVFNTYGVLL